MSIPGDAISGWARIDSPRPGAYLPRMTSDSAARSPSRRAGDRAAPDEDHPVPAIEAPDSLVHEREARRGRRRLVPRSGFSEPDGIASAMAERPIAAPHGVDPVLLDLDDPGHEENRAPVQPLEVERVCSKLGCSREEP